MARAETAFAPAIAAPARRRRPCVLPQRRPPLAMAAAAEKLVRATVARTGERVLVRRARLGAAAPLVLCPACAAAFSGAALRGAALVRCSLCAHEFTAEPGGLYEQVAGRGARAAGGALARTAAPEAAPGEIRCEHFAHCPGCELATGADTPPVAARAAAFARSLGFRGRWRVSAGRSERWRTHAKLAVREARGRALRVGLYRARSHDVVQIAGCAVHAAEVNAAAAAVRDAIAETGVSAFCEATGDGMVRYVLLQVQRHTRRVQVTLVWNARSWKDAQPHAQRVGGLLWRLHGPALLHSVWFNWNVSAANAIVAPARDRFYRMHGSADLEERILGKPVFFAPYAFRQANLDLFEEKLLPALLRYIPEGSSVVEFCAGVGVIGLSALKAGRVSSLIATEINPAAEELFWKSLRASHAPRGVPRPQVKYVVGSDAETKDYAHEGADIVIVDPPRAGLSEELVRTLANPPKSSKLRRIIYVSCGYDAFRKESAEIVGSGVWKLIGAEGFVLFPGVDHVEILAVFDRPFLQGGNPKEVKEADDTSTGKKFGRTNSSRDWKTGRKAPPVDTTRKRGTPPPRGRGRKSYNARPGKYGSG